MFQRNSSSTPRWVLAYRQLAAGALRDWAEDLLSETKLRADDFFDPGPIRATWQEHLSGRRNHQYLLWDVLMFQAWREAQRNYQPALAA